MSDKENLGPAGKAKKVRWPQLLLAIVVGIFGLTQLLQGIKALTASGMPDKQEQIAAAEKSLSSLKEFNETGGKLKLSYPASWEVEKPGPRLFKIQLFKGCVNLNVTKEKVPVGVTAAQYLQAIDDEVSKNHTEIKMKKVSQDSADLNGTPAIKRIQIMQAPSDGKTLTAKQVSIICLKDNDVYTFAFSALEEFFPQFEPVFNKMIGSIKFTRQ